MNGLYHTGATELHDIFLAPLQAVIDAEISLSESVKNFIINTGFDTENNNKIRTVDFQYKLDGKTQELKVPVLSIITLPLLGIKDAEFDMQVKMMSILEDHEKLIEIPPLKNGDQLPKKKSKVALKGYMTPTVSKTHLTESSSLKTNMKVKLHMGETSMPGGLIKLLAVVNNNLINEKTLENDESNK